MKEQRKGAQEPRIIRNKDLILLSRVLCIMQDVCSLEKRMAWQYDRMFGVTAHITGMPGGKGAPSGFDAAFAAINSIPSRTMRTFVVMLYVDNLPATTVRRELNMTEYGFTRARNAVEQARDMQSVVWRERYILEKDSNSSKNT